MLLLYLTLAFVIVGGGIWFLYTEILMVKYTKFKVLGFEIKRAVMNNKFKKRNKLSSGIIVK